MRIISTLQDWREIKNSLNASTLGFIPTMGNLHEGHLNLCQQSKSQNDVTVVSIFVNPTQFNQKNDLDNYPRTLDRDEAHLREVGVDYLILPEPNEVYADNYEIQVNETILSQEFEGEHRPGHFTGMLTVVLKLLNWVQPNKAYFGEKDFQQLLLVKKMVQSLFLPIEVVACETVREADGLAMSSRNSRLNPTERELAPHFYHWLKSAESCDKVKTELEKLGFKVDYIVEKWNRRLGAVRLGDIRLIDNV